MNIRKISTRQFFIMYCLLMLAPAIRLFPTFVAQKAGGKAYIPIIVGGVLTLGTIFILSVIFKKRQHTNLGELITDIFGKPIGIALLVIYFLWAFLVFSLYIRFFGEKMSSTLIPEAKIEIIMLTMLALCFYIMKNDILSAARFIEILFCIFVVIFIFLNIFTIFEEGDIYNFEFWGNFDIKGLTEGCIAAFSAYSYLVFLFFFFDKVKYKGDLMKKGSRSIIYIVTLCLLLVISTVGVLGAGASSRLATPYFSVIKNISIFQTIERFESIIFSAWITVDFTIIFVFGYIALTILKQIFNLKYKRLMVTPLLLFGFSMALFAGNNSFEVESLSNSFLVYGNLILTIPLVFLLLIIGKMRKKI